MPAPAPLTNGLGPNRTTQARPLFSFVVNTFTLVFAVVITLSLTLIFHHRITPPSALFSSPLSLSSNDISSLSALITPSPSPRCAYPLVYNKPPKTASTHVQFAIADWAARHNRSNYDCSTQPFETAIYLRECVPRTDDGCGVLNCHVILNTYAMDVVRERLPRFRLVTSTRYPPHRIVSHFLQINRIQANDTERLNSRLRSYLQRKFNPWRLFNFHVGTERFGSCPLRLEESSHIWATMTRYDFVVDANIPEASNVILKHNGLFQLPISSHRENPRGAWATSLSEETLEALHNVSCVEREMHKALLLRMASLYERATGKRCITHGRRAALTSCLEDMERERLKDNWMS